MVVVMCSYVKMKVAKFLCILMEFLAIWNGWAMNTLANVEQDDIHILPFWFSSWSKSVSISLLCLLNSSVFVSLIVFDWSPCLKSYLGKFRSRFVQMGVELFN